MGCCLIHRNYFTPRSRYLWEITKLILFTWDLNKVWSICEKAKFRMNKQVSSNLHNYNNFFIRLNSKLFFQFSLLRENNTVQIQSSVVCACYPFHLHRVVCCKQQIPLSKRTFSLFNFLSLLFAVFFLFLVCLLSIFLCLTLLVFCNRIESHFIVIEQQRCQSIDGGGWSRNIKRKNEDEAEVHWNLKVRLSGLEREEVDSVDD